MRRSISLWLIPALLWIAAGADAANIYVDQNLSANITNGTYSISARNASGSDGNAFRTIAGAVQGMAPGDDIYLRGGTYYERDIRIDSKNGTAANWASIQSYPGEWAIVDGQRLSSIYNVRALFWGNLAYWRLERLELRGGGQTTGDDYYAAAIRGWPNCGPLVIRWCYIHDNKSTWSGGNPCGVYLNTPHDVLIEYCWFKDNGSDTMDTGNASQIALFSDYKEISSNDFNPNDATKRNEVRYCLFEGSNAGIKHKNQQIYGEANRNPLDMTYKNWGDKIHHNIIRGLRGAGIQSQQDFCQMYNNIIDYTGMTSPDQTESGGIFVKKYTDLEDIYQNAVYNNTILYPECGGVSVSTEGGSFSRQYHYIFNNISMGSKNSYINKPNRDFSVGNDLASGGTVDLTYCPFDRNYAYGPIDGAQFYVGRSPGAISTTDFNSRYGKHNYSNGTNSGDALFQGTGGAARYKTRSSHVLSGTATIQNGGIGIAHPFLDTVRIPSYVGATNPNKDSGLQWNPSAPDPDDSGWVDFVLSLNATSNLLKGGGGGSVSLPVPGVPPALKVIQ